jgi:hypothetical protein
MSDELNSPKTLRAIWLSLSNPKKSDIANVFWQSCDSWHRTAAISFLAKKYKSRQQTVARWPIESLSQKLLSQSIPESLIDDIFRAYFFARHREMMRLFLDGLAIPHEECSFSPEDIATLSRSQFRYAAQELLRDFQIDDVDLYFNFLLATDFQFWEPLQDVILEAGSLAALRSLPPEPRPENATVREIQATHLVQSVESPPSTAASVSETPELPAQPAPAGGSVTSSELRNQLDFLKTRMHSLAKTLADTSAALKSEQFEDVESAHELLSIYGAESKGFVVRLRETLTARGLSVDVADCRAAEQALDQLLLAEKSKKEEADRVSWAVALLDDVIDIKHVDGTQFVPLLECQDQARALQTKLKSNDYSSGDLNRLDPFSALLSIVNREDTNDVDIEEHFELVASVFSSKLAYAADRKKLILPNYDSTLTELVEESTTSPSHPASREGTIEVVPVEEIGEDMSISSPPREVEAKNAQPYAGSEIVVACAPDAESTAPQTPDGPAPSAMHSQPKTESTAVSEAQLLNTPFSGDLEHSRAPVPLTFRTVPGETAQACAATLVESAGEPAWDDIERVVWLCLREGSLGTAYNVAQLSECLYTERRRVNPAVLRALALAAHVAQSAGLIAQLLKRDIETFKAPEQQSVESLSRSECMLMVAALLRPSLVAPELHASDYLRALSIELKIPSLHRLCQRLVEHCASTHIPLDPLALKYLNDKSKWKDDCERLRTEVEAWWIRAPQLQFSFQSALRVWRAWLQPGNQIENLLAPIRGEQQGDLAEMQRSIDRLSSDSRLRTEIDLVDRNLRKHSVGRGINSASVQMLRRHVHEALAFATRWIEFQRAKSSRDDSYHAMQIQKLKAELERMMPTILGELSHQRSLAPSDLRLQTSLDLLRQYLGGFLQMLSQGEEEDNGERPIRYILNFDLLRASGLELDSEWSPVNCPPDVALRKVLGLVAHSKTVTWKVAFDKRSEEDRDHVITGQIIEFMEAEKLESISAREELRKKRSRGIEACRDALRRTIEDVQKKVEYASAFGLLSEAERAQYLNHIRIIEESVDSLLRYRAEFAVLDDIKTQLSAARLNASVLVRDKMQGAHIDPTGDAGVRIEAALQEGDILSANEYLDLVKKGHPIPEKSNDRVIFDSFFPEMLIHLEEQYGENLPATSLLNSIQRGKTFLNIKFGSLSDTQRTEAVEMMNSWYALKKQKQIGADQEGLKLLLRRIGFEVTELIGAGTHRAWLSMRTEVISDRNLCPVPYFGSQANGQYRLFCVWDRASEEQIAAEAGRAQSANSTEPRRSQNANPLIVIYFGCLDETKRREFARICRSERRSFLVLDESLMMFLCGERGSRLTAFFQCTLPFTHVNPYSTTASLVPPEMFYGRREEQRAIMDPNGSCFIYGGRQLGKTALLLSVERDFHDPSRGQVACWIDLRASGVIHEQIWPGIAAALKHAKAGNLMEHLPVNATRAKIFDEILKWLTQDESRRILLLLDEADQFLKADASEPGTGGGFPDTQLLKNLMERTKRRFKVVFAGLHNVQRTSHQRNQPLAHFGEPICIGPLLERGEFREARALIEKPLESLGFRFTSPDLVTRILSQTNFYPSLIQVFCNQLLLHLTRPGLSTFDMRKGPPFKITAAQVEDVYLSPDLRHSIRSRFDLTLRLDARYRVIALLIALESRPGSTGELQGFDVDWIRKEAVSYWSKGFADVRSEDDFRALLEEMVGLGILGTVDGRFALRTPNILSLLGSTEEIEEKLWSSMDMEPPTFEPYEFRAGGTLSDNWKRSPLTVFQEGRLRTSADGISVICGTKAGGLEDLEPFLRRACGDEYFLARGAELASRADFERVLGELNARQKFGTTVLLITDRSPWTDTWIDYAHIWLRQRRNKNAFVRIAFVADPENLWRVLSTQRNLSGFLQKMGAETLTLHPWHRSVLGQWIAEWGIGTGTTTEQAEIANSTGSWPFLLADFKQRCGTSHDWSAKLEELCSFTDSPEGRQHLREGFGLKFAECLKVLRVAEKFEPITKEELATLLEDDTPSQMIDQVMVWADMLSLARPSEGHAWVLDPMVSKAVVQP